MNGYFRGLWSAFKRYMGDHVWAPLRDHVAYPLWTRSMIIRSNLEDYLWKGAGNAVKGMFSATIGGIRAVAVGISRLEFGIGSDGSVVRRNRGEGLKKIGKAILSVPLMAVGFWERVMMGGDPAPMRLKEDPRITAVLRTIENRGEGASLHPENFTSDEKNLLDKLGYKYEQGPGESDEAFEQRRARSRYHYVLNRTLRKRLFQGAALSAAYFTIRNYWDSPKEDRKRQRVITPLSLSGPDLGGDGYLALSMYYNNK